MVDPNFHQVESWGTPIIGKVVENVEVGGVFFVLFAKFWFDEVFLKFVIYCRIWEVAVSICYVTAKTSCYPPLIYSSL